MLCRPQYHLTDQLLGYSTTTMLLYWLIIRM